MKLYLAVTRDKYRLPVAVADSLDELARMTGAKKYTIASAISRGYGIYERVEVEDEEDE